jgi:hypothetical protein
VRQCNQGLPKGSKAVGLFSAAVKVSQTTPASKLSTLTPQRRIALLVAVVYFGCALFIFRGVAASIPQILRGDAVINGDELVPFFNPTSQLFDQAAGHFNQLTNGYEFRVRYSFLTTWMRYYQVLPFALILVIPAVTYLAYLVTSKFLAASLATEPAATEQTHPENGAPFVFSPSSFFIAAAAPIAVIFLILTYSKITHFYTLILGFSLFLIACTQVTYGLIFAHSHPYRPIVLACLITLFNPAVHYLVLFALYLSLTVTALLLLEGWRGLRGVGPQPLAATRRWFTRRFSSGWWQRDAKLSVLSAFWRQFRYTTLMRSLLALALLGLLTLLPYWLFVHFYALRGVSDLAETVAGDYYFISDSSIPLPQILAFDMAGIMDKTISGDYLSQEPRLPNFAYSILLFLPLALPALRREVFSSWPRRQFLFVCYCNVIFSIWATLGYATTDWLPTFHRLLAYVSLTAYGTETVLGDFVVKLTGVVVQVLRFPHRFQLTLFVMACLLIPISLAWLAQKAQASLHRYTPRFSVVALPVLAVLFLAPLFSNWQYRETFLSGNFRNFLAPYPVGPLKDVKEVLKQLPPGKVVVLPPTEAAKVVVDLAGVEHKFIDKFYIYYLDLPSYYYGLTGDPDNKFEFFLLLRGLYYQQDWWINIARDLDIRYFVLNKELIPNTMGGAEYLRELEKVVTPQFDRLPQSLRQVYANDSFAVYEALDLPKAARPPLWINTGWNNFLNILANNPELTRYYDLRHTGVSTDLNDEEHILLLTDDLYTASLDLYVKTHEERFFAPDSSIFAFNPAIISSSYYLSPMFRLFHFLSDSKWNRLNLVTPGLYGAIQGSFIGLPTASQIRLDARFPTAGQYRILLRGAATWNRIAVHAKPLGYAATLDLRASPDAVGFFDQRTVFSAERTPLDISYYSRDELERLIPKEIVAINYRYQYFDLGTVTADKGGATFSFDKQDNNPMLIEGILVLSEAEYQSLRLPANVQVVNSPSELCCTMLVHD